MRGLATLALVLALVLAGCGGTDAPAFGGADRPTVTPAAVPHDPPAAPGRTLAPGLTREGVFDPNRLAAAHAAVLADTSYTVHRVEQRTYRNGTVRSRYESTVRVAAGGDRFRYVLEQADYRGETPRERRVGRWMDDGSGFERHEDASGSVRYRRLSDPDAVLPERATNRYGLARVLSAVDLRVTGTTERGGRTLYHLGVEGTPEDLPPLRSVAVDAVVDDRGVVRSYDLTYRVERAGTPTRVTVRVAFDALGATRVVRPLWYDEAAEAVGEGDAGTTPSSRSSPPQPRNDSTGRSLAAFHAG